MIDEADSLLNFHMMSKHDKGWINDFLDQPGGRMIWITNDIGGMPESTQRRFAYSLRFRPFSTQDRLNIWKTCLQDHPLGSHLTPETVADLASRYQVNAGGIASALDTARLVMAGRHPEPEQVKEHLAELLTRHAELTGNLGEERLGPVAPQYDVDTLNIDADRAELIATLKAFYKTNGREPGNNVNFLFHGAPGTGKTEFAKYLAQQAGRDLLVRRYSDLESKWVGETEQNIRDAFAEADRAGTILFIDEADSFFTDRENAFRSWEVSRTNEMLTRMENHRGVLICATNLLDGLDQASLRRFDWKVLFKPLLPDSAVRLFKRYFQAPLSPADAHTLRRIPGLTPGLFKAVWHKNRFLPPQSAPALVAALNKETDYQGAAKPVGIGF